MIFPLVREMAEAGAPLRVPVTVACRVLGFSTQAYYKWKQKPISDRDWNDAKIVNELHDINGEDPTLGYRFLTDELEEAGIKRSENSVHRLCRVGRISACHAAKKGKRKQPGPPVHDDMLAKIDDCGRVRHHFAASRPDEVWLTDITEHPTREGKLYLCAVKDVCSRKIVGYSMDSRMRSSLACRAISNAIAVRRPSGTVCHSDRGSQFRSRKVTRLLRSHELTGSMGRVGAAGDNAAMESFFSLLQKNVLNMQTWETREELRLAIASWIETKYNRRRRQRALGKLTPVEFEAVFATV